MPAAVKIKIKDLQDFLAAAATKGNEDFVLVNTYLDDVRMVAEFRVPDKVISNWYWMTMFSSDPIELPE